MKNSATTTALAIGCFRLLACSKQDPEGVHGITPASPSAMTPPAASSSLAEVAARKFPGPCRVERRDLGGPADASPSVSEYAYDSNGNKTRETLKQPGQQEPTVHEKTYEYGPKAKVMKLEQFRQKPRGQRALILRQKNEYDDRGNLIKKEEDLLDEKATTKELHSYDARNRQVWKEDYFNGRLSLRYEYEYGDDSANVSVERRYLAGRVFNAEVRFTYNGAGWLIFEDSTSDPPLLHGRRIRGYTKYSYDGRGHLLTLEGSTDKGTFVVGKTQTWDDNGNLLSEVWNDHKRLFTYDAAGNMLTEESEWNVRGARPEHILMKYAYDCFSR